jgi:MotA/TolQ/ExbB proton channel family
LCEQAINGHSVALQLTRTADRFKYEIKPVACTAPGVEAAATPEASTSRTGTFYVLERQLTVLHPRLQDSIHVLLRNIEGVWFGKPHEEMRLCSESRKPLDAASCERIETIRLILDGERPHNNGAPPNVSALVRHLDSVKWGALLFGPIQFLTLTVFLFALMETLGLGARWLWAPDYSSSFVAEGLTAPLPRPSKKSFESKLVVASGVRMRAFIDRFLEKALSPSTTAAETRLRNFRDFLLDDCVSHMDTLEMLGDTMLKVAFLGTVYGIGSSLFEARNLDASDPLVRLTAKSEMYAGIGMGFGATMVGIALSIAAAKLRAWLSSTWMAKIDRAWREAMTFYDINYTGAKGIPIVDIPGVNVVPVPYKPKERIDKFIDGLLTFLGVLGLIALAAYLFLHYHESMGKALW